MEHYYQDIYGWFDGEELFQYAVKQMPSKEKSLFVSLGSYLGKSDAFMGVEIINSGKPIDFYCIDVFEQWNQIENLCTRPEMIAANYNGKHFFDLYLKNIRPIRDLIRPYRIESEFASSFLFDDNTIDFLYIDAGHDYHNFRKDLYLWYPRVKPGGIICGDDFGLNERSDWPDVEIAVSEFATAHNLKLESEQNKIHLNSYGNCWMMIKKGIGAVNGL